jgi:hypothetical protein
VVSGVSTYISVGFYSRGIFEELMNVIIKEPLPRTCLRRLCRDPMCSRMDAVVLNSCGVLISESALLCADVGLCRDGQVGTNRIRSSPSL